MHKSEKISILGILSNFILFVLKLIVGLLSNSLAIISDSFNSLTDTLASTGIFFAVKISNKRADHDHPFGHRRAEPIAGLVVAIFSGVLGFEVIKDAINNIINPTIIKFSLASIGVLVFSIIVNTWMGFYFIKKGQELKRPALRATGIDSKNDVLVSFVALFSVFGARLGFPILDSIASIIISIFIFRSTYQIAIENIDYLMGHAPSEEIIQKIKEKTLKIIGVKGFNEVKAHYVGSYVHVEVHIDVDKKLTTEKSHAIGKQVQTEVEKIDEVDKAFIHIDPV